MSTPQPVDPVLAQATRRMIRCLDEVERDNVREALEEPGDRHQLLQLLVEALELPER